MEKINIDELNDIYNGIINNDTINEQNKIIIKFTRLY